MPRMGPRRVRLRVILRSTSSIRRARGLEPRCLPCRGLSKPRSWTVSRNCEKKCRRPRPRGGMPWHHPASRAWRKRCQVFTWPGRQAARSNTEIPQRKEPFRGEIVPSSLASILPPLVDHLVLLTEDPARKPTRRVARPNTKASRRETPAIPVGKEQLWQVETQA